MKLIRRMSSGLFSPQEIVNYQTDSRWLTALFLVVLVLLMSLPNLLMIHNEGNFDYREKLALRKSFIVMAKKYPLYQTWSVIS